MQIPLFKATADSGSDRPYLQKFLIKILIRELVGPPLFVIIISKTNISEMSERGRPALRRRVRLVAGGRGV